MKKVLVVNDIGDMGGSYYAPFYFVGPSTNDIELLNTEPQNIALVVFTGGSDVDPSLYNEKKGKFTHVHERRDEQEIEVFQKARSQNIPLFGICRGLQFLTVMFGGQLVQHTVGHHTSHHMTTSDGAKFPVSSSHHQMVLPTNKDEILGWASPRLSNIYLDGNDQQMKIEKEIEAVHFKGKRAVGVQYHPEIMGKKSEGFLYVKDLIERYLLVS